MKLSLKENKNTLFVTGIAVNFADGQEVIWEGSVCAESVLEKKPYPERFRELKKLLGKTMSRSLKKGPYIDANLIKKVIKQKGNESREAIKTWARNSQVAPEFVGHRIAVHNGKKFIEVYISESMVGHYLGEFSQTRTFKGHGKVTKKTAEKT